MAVPGRAEHGEAQRGATRLDETRFGEAARGATGPDLARQDKVRFDQSKGVSIGKPE